MAIITGTNGTKVDLAFARRGVATVARHSR